MGACNVSSTDDDPHGGEAYERVTLHWHQAPGDPREIGSHPVSPRVRIDRNAARWQDMNARVIAEFRANGGVVRSRRHPVILLTTHGAKTGRPHVTPLNFTRHGDRISVIASKGGAAAHPDWYHNLVANPEVTIEDGGDTFRARAIIVAEPERTRLFDQQAAAMPFFEGYRRRVKARQIPVVVFERIADGADHGRRMRGGP